MPCASALAPNLTMPANLTVMVNGEKREVPAGSNVEGLLEHLGISAGRVAIERNLEILPRAQWAATQVLQGDRLEIVHFVGGG
jgi:thiamine biosynthesis protein ThiS